MSELKNHPINIIKVLPLELSIKSHVDPDVKAKYGNIPYSITAGHSDYNSKDNTIVVGIKLETGKAGEGQEPKIPFSLVVELVATFKVNETKFPIEKLRDWAVRNAPFIIYPYLREHVYALTIRAGFRPMILPLVEVPTFKIIPSPKEAKPLEVKRSGISRMGAPIPKKVKN